jgi:hypothetical protein
MAVKKQPDSDVAGLHEDVEDWFRTFIKSLELSLVELGRELPPRAKSIDCARIALRSVKLILRDSGLADEQIVGLLSRVALENADANEKLQWNAELNRRRFELIDRDVQGRLGRAEQLELAGLTQLMREHVDSEENLPMEGAKKLHRRLSGRGSGATDSL